MLSSLLKVTQLGGRPIRTFSVLLLLIKAVTFLVCALGARHCVKWCPVRTSFVGMLAPWGRLVNMSCRWKLCHLHSLTIRLQISLALLFAYQFGNSKGQCLLWCFSFSYCIHYSSPAIIYWVPAAWIWLAVLSYLAPIILKTSKQLN